MHLARQEPSTTGHNRANTALDTFYQLLEMWDGMMLRSLNRVRHADYADCHLQALPCITMEVHPELHVYSSMLPCVYSSSLPETLLPPSVQISMVNSPTTSMRAPTESVSWQNSLINLLGRQAVNFVACVVTWIHTVHMHPGQITNTFFTQHMCLWVGSGNAAVCKNVTSVRFHWRIYGAHIEVPCRHAFRLGVRLDTTITPCAHSQRLLSVTPHLVNTKHMMHS